MSQSLPTVVITGASAGIGKALAETYAAQGYQVALLARRQERIAALAAELTARTGRRAIAYAVDVTNTEQLAECSRRIRAELGPASVVIANAGFGVMGNFLDLSADDYRRQFETNIFGVLHTLKVFAEDLVATRGRAVIISSVMGYVTLPGTSAYAMSKHALQAFGEAVRGEWKSLGISLTVVCPGFVRTEIRQVDNHGNFREAGRDPIPLWLQMTPEVAARKIFRAVRARRSEITLTGHAKVLLYLRRFVPGLLRFVVNTMGVRGRAEG